MKATRLSRKLSGPGILVPLVVIIGALAAFSAACGCRNDHASSTTSTTQAVRTASHHDHRSSHYYH